MKNKRKKILVTIDHSQQSIDAAGYISTMLHPLESDVTLFHVESDLFDVFFDGDDKPPTDLPGSAHFSDWMDLQKRSIDDNMEAAQQFFLNKDFPKDHVQIVKKPLNKGISRDILTESQDGYDLLVTGKSGSNKLSNVLTGTVTSKLMTRTFHIPLAMVSGTPNSHKVMVGYDGSGGANKAVEAAARLLRNNLSEVQICHVIRSFNLAVAQNSQAYTSFYNSYLPELEEALIKIRREKMEPKLTTACEEFVRQGFLPSAVRWSMINRSSSRSRALLDMAAKQDCGTLILGRRGFSAVEEFFMGRVGKKVVEFAESIAVWII